MAREKFPSDDVDRLMVRFPPGMRDRVAEVAKANGRSMNSEIVARLQATLEGPQPVSQIALGKEEAVNLAKAMEGAYEKMVELGGGIQLHFTIIPDEYMKSDGVAHRSAEEATTKKPRARKRLLDL